MSSDYDLAIIGAGSAGLTAARFAARLGKRVALIEANRVGGDCTWTGCVPSKTLLHAARVAHTVRNGGKYGVHAGALHIDFPAVMSRIRRVIEQLHAAESPARLRAEGIDVIEARAAFADSRTVMAGGRSINAKRFLIATGASPVIPAVPGLTETTGLTYANFWQLESLPSRLVIVGGGLIGCELAQACQRLGSQVTLVEAQPNILPDDEPEVSDTIAGALQRDGVDLRRSAPLESARGNGEGSVTITVAGGRSIHGDGLLIAAGRRPNVGGLGLESAGIDYGSGGIVVDDCLRTGARNVYAAGDCVGGFQFTHYAGFQGAMAVRNMMWPGGSSGRPAGPPRATFTDPEAAQVGYTEAQARQRYGDKVRVAMVPMTSIDRAVTDDCPDGFIKAVYRDNGTVLGATVVGRQAAEALQGWAIATERNLKMGDVARVMQAYPTLAAGNQQIAWDAYVGGLTQGLTGRALKWLSR